MPFTPTSPLNISYKKFSGQVSRTVVSLPVDPYTTRLYVTGAPTWLSVTNITFNATSGNFVVQVREPSANALTPGNYTANLSVRVDFQEPDMLEPASLSYGTFVVNLTVINTIILAVDPTALNFEFDPALAPPVEKLVRITSENAWDIVASDSWITTSLTSGSNSATFYVGVDAAALPFGFYQGTVTVNDGAFQRVITVYLTVRAPIASTDYLYLNPQNLEFLSEVNVANNVEKSLNVDTTANWSVVSSAAWLQTDISNGPSGLTPVAVSVDSDALAVGAYFGDLTFTSAGIVAKVFVALRVVDFAVDGLSNGTLYFSEDRNTLSVGSISDNSFLRLEVELSSQGETAIFFKEQPYFRGIAKAIIGTETPRYIPSLKPTDNFNTRVIQNIQPVNIKLTAYEKHRFTGYTPVVANYENLYFLKGRTPKVTDRASYIPSNITVSNKAILSLSVISAEAPQQIFISGAINHIHTGAMQDGQYLYTAIINLADFILNQGDVININYDGKQVNVQIDNDYVELHTIAFENEWGEFEFFETRGHFTIDAQVDREETQRAIGGITKTLVLEADEDARYSLNTGFIQTKEEVQWLSKILNAKQVFIWMEDVWMPMVLTTNRLQVYETRNHINAYQLNFERAEK